MDVFELLIGAKPRPWWRQRLIATVWVAAVLAAIAATTWILLADQRRQPPRHGQHLPALASS